MNRHDSAHLIQFLQTQLGVPAAAIEMALHRCQSSQAPLFMVLWHYGLVTLEQLDQTFDWLESA